GFFFSSRRRHTRSKRDWSSDVCSSDLIPNFLILEYRPDDRAPRRDFVQEPMRLENGYLALPTAPGLGIELNEEAFEHYPFKPWRSEERRVGKECRYRWGRDQEKRKQCR